MSGSAPSDPPAGGRHPGANDEDRNVGSILEVGDRYHVPIDPHADNNAHAWAIEMVGTGRRVLELGCATGNVTRYLVEARNTVVGAEFDPAAAERARSIAERVHVIDLDRDRLSERESELFDVVLAGDVLEHLRDPLSALRDALELLAPGGDVIVSVPNLVHGDVRLHVLEGRVDYLPEGLLDRTHLRWFTRESLQQLLADAALVPVDVRRVKIALGDTNLDVDWSLHGRGVLDFVRSDPEHDTFQFVVRAQRRADLDADTLAELDAADLLAPFEWLWSTYPYEDVGEMREYVHDLRLALDAWENSRSARALTTLRRAVAKLPIVGR